MTNRKMNQTPIKQNQNNDTILFIGFLSLILLHIIGGFFNSYYSWGFSYWSVFPENIIIWAGVVSIVAMTIVYFYRRKIRLEFLNNFQISDKSTSVRTLLSVFLFVLITFLLFIFRSKSHYYGDGFLIIGKILKTEEMFTESKNMMEMFTIYLYYFITLSAKYFGNFSTIHIISLLNSVAGTFGIWGIWSVSKLIGESREKALFIFMSTLTSASVILFFGYIENYTLALVAGLWTLRFAIGYLNKVNSIAPLIFLGILSIGFHMITIPFLVIALYSILIRTQKIKLITELQNKSIALIFLIGTLVVVFISQLKGYKTFVPLLPIEHNAYSLFSIEHISDILNQLVLVAPVGLLFCVYVLTKRNENKQHISNVHKILFTLSIFTFLGSTVIDPQLGALRDWDLLSFYGIPLTIYSAYLVTQYYGNNKFANWITVSVFIIAVIHVIPNLYEKNNPHIAVEFLDNVIWDDPHYKMNYQDAYRGSTWGYILRKESKRNDLAEKYFSRRLTANKQDYQSYYNLGVMQLEQKNYDSARYYLQEGFRLNPTEAKFLSKLSIIEKDLENFVLAEEYAIQSVKIDSNHAEGLTSLAILYSIQNKMDEALIYFRKAYDLIPQNFSHVVNLGILYESTQQYDSALYYLNKSMLVAPEKHKPDILATLITIHLFKNEIPQAEKRLEELKSIAPKSDLIQEKEQEISRKKK